jgi:hypothetical protein
MLLFELSLFYWHGQQDNGYKEIGLLLFSNVFFLHELVPLVYQRLFLRLYNIEDGIVTEAGET